MESKTLVTIFTLTIAALSFAGAVFAHSPKFTDSFREDGCKFSSTGRNPFFILEPGHELVLEGDDEGEAVKLVITVLNRTKVINGIETRVVRERETKDGELVEISKNYFAICKQTNSVFYFGEDVNFYENGQVVSHDGSWRAGVDGAEPGIIMPGTILIGARYHQETAPGIAMDRGEIRRIDATVTTLVAQFTDCVEVRETTPLEPDALEFKFHAPGVGLVMDGPLLLTRVTTAAGAVYPEW